MATDDWLEPNPADPLTGEETLVSGELTVSDFWRWAFSDLRENITRGVLAEYLVARAVGDASPLRHAWDNFDVTTPDGVKIEVKSSAYLQSWRQRALSKITFSGLTGRAYSYETNEFDDERSLRANLYVFALHSCQDPSQYDALELDSWEFFVVPVATLRAHGSPRSVSLATLTRWGIPSVPFAGLAAAVNGARSPS